MKEYLKQAYLLSILFVVTGAVYAQKNSYEDRGPVFNTRPNHPLLLFGNVQSIQIEDSFFIENVFTHTIKVDYTAHRYFYDIHRRTNRVLQLHAPLDTSYDIEYLNYETHFIRKGTWYGPYEQTYTEIDTPNKNSKELSCKRR